MSVAAELSRGNGFTTRWLEHPFLTPYAVPRPDDYRYPVFSMLLAQSFRLFGITYKVALWATALIFILFCISVYIVVKYIYGIRTAAVTLALTAFSLLQIEYASQVYCEGLFGLVVTWIIYFSMRFDVRRHRWWITNGILTGILYLIRPNGILLISALIIYYFIIRKQKSISVALPALSIGISVAIISPWLLRNYMFFGNPFHLAGSAGLLRATNNDPITFTFSQFLKLHGVFYFVKAILTGILNFFNELPFFEHGIHFIPLFFGILAIFRKRAFYNGFILASFLISFLACAYTAKMSSWAGIRYFSSFLPFIYAYGISFLFYTADQFLYRISSKTGKLCLAFGFIIVFITTVAPIVNPHRYYERYFRTKTELTSSISHYYSELDNQLSANNGLYYANSLAQLNFARTYSCVGVQQLVDEKEIVRAQKHFNPSLMVLTRDEFKKPRYKNLLQALQKENYSWSVSAENDYAVFIRIEANGMYR